MLSDRIQLAGGAEESMEFPHRKQFSHQNLDLFGLYYVD